MILKITARNFRIFHKADRNPPAVLARRPPPIRGRTVRAMEALPAEFKRDTQYKIALGRGSRRTSRLTST